MRVFTLSKDVCDDPLLTFGADRKKWPTSLIDYCVRRGFTASIVKQSLTVEHLDAAIQEFMHDNQKKAPMVLSGDATKYLANRKIGRAFMVI